MCASMHQEMATWVDALEGCVVLKHLEASNTDLVHITALASCTSLKVLDVTNNSLTGLPSAPLPASLTQLHTGWLSQL